MFKFSPKIKLVVLINAIFIKKTNLMLVWEAFPEVFYLHGQTMLVP